MHKNIQAGDKHKICKHIRGMLDEGVKSIVKQLGKTSQQTTGK